MQVLFLVLDKTEMLAPVLKTFLDCGLQGATILQSTGMGRVLSDEVPIFASLRQVMNNGRHHNQTIFTVIKDEEKVDRLIAALDKVLGGFDKPGTGIIFTFPVTRAVGLSDGIC